jgi:hypothetical protein
VSQRQRVHSPLSRTYYGTYVPCSPYTHPEYRAIQLTTLMASLEYVQAYIDDFLIATRGILVDCLSKIELVLTRLHNAELKVNAAKSVSCTHKIKYLGYILTREGIKPQPKKVQTILMLNPLNSIMELQDFLRMI